MTKLYRKAIVLRTNPAHVAKLGAPAFDGLFTANLTGENEIRSYFAQKMTDEGYAPSDYEITISLVTIDAATGRAIAKNA
jgi:hypothetical protein